MSSTYKNNLQTVAKLVEHIKGNFTKNGSMDANGVIDALANMLYVLSNRSEDNAQFLEAKVLWKETVEKAVT